MKEIQAKQTIVDSILEVILKSIWDVHPFLLKIYKKYYYIKCDGNANYGS